MNFFRRLLKTNPKLPLLDLNVLGTDLHSHLIPGIDDGSKNMDQTIAMLEKFIELGYQKVITTPHVMSDFYRNSSETILNGLSDVREEIKKRGLSIEIEAAAEYYLDYHFNELIDANDVLTFGDRHVLFELSFSQEQQGIEETVFKLTTEGYRPILAHVERYPYYHGDWKKIERYRDRGVLLQLNINSLSGQYGPGVKKMAEQLIERDWIDVIGSDCHHMGHLELIESLRKNAWLHRVVGKEGLLNMEL